MTDRRHLRYAIFLATVALVSAGYLFLILYFLLGAVSNIYARVPFLQATAGRSTEWQTYSTLASGTTFQYPRNFGTQYVEPVNWPPSVETLNVAFSCSGTRELRVITGRTFCVLAEKNGDTFFYSYAFEYGPDDGWAEPGTVILSFGARYPDCTAFDDDESGACAIEQTLFNPDELVANMVQTFNMKTPPVSIPEG